MATCPTSLPPTTPTRIKRHDKAVWEILKLLIYSPLSRCMTLMNAGYYNKNPPNNTVPSWLLPCTCLTQRCQCNARLRPDILCIHGIPYQGTPPTQVNASLTIQFIEFTYTNNRYPEDKITAKKAKHQPFIQDIQNLGWKVAPLIVLTAGARGTTHIPSIKTLQETYKYLQSRTH
jgi:hypothetical protein